MYFELAEIPGRRHFNCERLRATLSVDSCARHWRIANEQPAEQSRFGDLQPPDKAARPLACRSCPLGATHAGVPAASQSPLRGMTICGRCHEGATRLIGKHLCVSCYNRQREQRIGKNGKGTTPKKLAPLERRSITWLASGQVKTLTLGRSLNIDELIVSVLRDEQFAVQFVPTMPASALALRQLSEVT